MEHTAHADSAITRRRALRDLGAAGVALGGLDTVLAMAAEASPAHGTMADIQHVVILIQENRSFDHYFGTYSGVRGFGDRHGRSAFFQKDQSGITIQPFLLGQECMRDITHDWGPQHRAWNRGRMDRFVIEHEKVDGAGGVDTMGYYDGADLAYYHALANAFTLCDGYYCSVIGPTDPNRLMSISATIDPAGRHGGPVVGTSLTRRKSRVSWPTMPESLDRKGITWKNYTDFKGAGQFDSVFTYFKQFNRPGKLNSRGLKPVYPDDFRADMASGRLPQVSWLTPSFTVSEHPEISTPVQGEIIVQQVLEALLAHPKVWRRTALFITWDENGGFLDHVAPPVAPRGTKGEYLTVKHLPSASDNDAQHIRGPIGLGFRVPMLVVSPFTRGGLVCPDRFDHTSTLRFLETRFRASVPNLSAWRRRVTGDLTSAFNFAARPAYGNPKLAAPAGSSNCTPQRLPVTQGPFPKQASGRRRRPSGIVR